MDHDEDQLKNDQDKAHRRLRIEAKPFSFELASLGVAVVMEEVASSDQESQRCSLREDKDGVVGATGAARRFHEQEDWEEEGDEEGEQERQGSTLGSREDRRVRFLHV